MQIHVPHLDLNRSLAGRDVDACQRERREDRKT
jgi:hypothetical protein